MFNKHAATGKLPQQVVLGSAWYDLLITAPFATPWSARFALAQLSKLQAQLFPSAPAPVLTEPLGLLFCTLMGSVVLVWSVVRVLRPEPWLGLADSVARALFASWMLYIWRHDGPAILALFLLPEIAWGIAQAVVCWPRRATVPFFGDNAAIPSQHVRKEQRTTGQ